MTRHTFEGMGTTIAVHSVDGPNRARRVFEEAELRFSRFLPDSELSLVNRDGSGGVEVSDEMRGLLYLAQELRFRTGGLVDIAVGDAVIGWGYDRPFNSLPGKPPKSAIMARGSWYIDDRTVTLGEGTKLDLGGLAKGWTCDRVVESGLADVASAGGDVRSSDPSLVVEVTDPTVDLAIDVPVGVGALATSSTSIRRWDVEGGTAHHIIDPRTMAPAVSPVVAASVVADTAIEAEAGAKAVLILGADGLAWADRQSWIRTAVVVWHDGSAYATHRRIAS